MKKALLSSVLLSSLAAAGPAFAAQCPPLLDHRIKTLQGDTLDLCALAGHPVLVVNTASKCGFTPQFEKLEGMYGKYKARGLVVLGFPSNDFRQELESDAQIGDFCRMTYGVKFPMASKSSVSGKDANPFFRQLAAATGEAPTWNFHKYLIAPDGRTVYSFATRTEPDAPEVMRRLEPMLH
ncbi:MAG: glutathione peroxidase [Betaproteobacteria bacterium]|nr:glutathione peroxidase [Betaproteobacteria bacterium]